MTGTTQLVGLWGCFGGRSPPKHPHFPLELRNFRMIWMLKAL